MERPEIPNNRARIKEVVITTVTAKTKMNGEERERAKFLCAKNQHAKGLNAHTIKEDRKNIVSLRAGGKVLQTWQS